MKTHKVSTGIHHWEQRNLLIPLGLSITHWQPPNSVGTVTLRVQPLIAAALAEAAYSGWQADEPTDFATLFSRSQVRTRKVHLRWRIDSVTIRLIRPIWEEHLVPHG